MHPVFSFERKFVSGRKDFFDEIRSVAHLKLIHPFVADIKVFKEKPDLTGTRYFVTFTNGIRLIEEVACFERDQLAIKVITYDKNIPYFFIRIYRTKSDNIDGGTIGMQLLCETKQQKIIFKETFPAIYRMGNLFFPEVLKGINSFCITGQPPEKLTISPDGQVVAASLMSHQQVRSPHEYPPS